MRRVKICLRKIRSLRCRFTQNWVFLHTLFLENEAQIDRNNYGKMLFMSKQVSLPKISSILQKMKIGQKSDIRPFSTKAFNFEKLFCFLDFMLPHVCLILLGIREFGNVEIFPLSVQSWQKRKNFNNDLLLGGFHHIMWFSESSYKD